MTAHYLFCKVLALVYSLLLSVQQALAMLFDDIQLHSITLQEYFDIDFLIFLNEDTIMMSE